MSHQAHQGEELALMCIILEVHLVQPQKGTTITLITTVTIITWVENKKITCLGNLIKKTHPYFMGK